MELWHIEWTSSEEDSVNRYANEMVRVGVAMFIAAGNNGVSVKSEHHALAEDVITVGALDKDTSIALYSSQGPTEEGRIKPNIAFVNLMLCLLRLTRETGMSDSAEQVWQPWRKLGVGSPHVSSKSRSITFRYQKHNARNRNIQALQLHVCK